MQAVPGAKWQERYGDYPIKTISCDSRERQADGLFVALSGLKYNGADFIKEAVGRGAKIVAKAAGSNPAEPSIPDGVALVEVADPKVFLRLAAHAYFGNPSRTVKTIGVTGTNGKTTVTYLLESMIAAEGKTCGVVGTVNTRIGKEIFASQNTTPGFLQNQRMLSQLSQQKVEYCLMEVSSHALHQGRVDGIDFAAGIFTNLTQDHLDYHAGMEDYFQAKALLFARLCDEAPALINTDDPYGERMSGLSRGMVMSYGIDRPAQVSARHIGYALDGTSFELCFPGRSVKIRTPLIGKHNVYNILAASAAAYALRIPVAAIAKGIAAMGQVPGRLESVATGKDFFVFIDYAHTPDGLINVLTALRAVTNNKILLVFGCGGDRDRSKRPQMGKAASGLADYVIVTSDNPRSEDPAAIIKDVTAGCTGENFEICPDRREAIGRALKRADRGNLILLAGKGHEDYQILKDKTVPFNEKAIVKELLHV